jgi:hypothetical protein
VAEVVVVVAVAVGEVEEVSEEVDVEAYKTMKKEIYQHNQPLQTEDHYEKNIYMMKVIKSFSNL